MILSKDDRCQADISPCYWTFTGVPAWGGPGLGRGHKPGTGHWQIANQQRLGRPPRRMTPLWREPPIKLLAAAVAWRRQRLVPASGLAGWAREADMEVLVVAPPRAYLGEPCSIRAGLVAQFPFDRGVDENARGRRLACERLEQVPVLRRPGFVH